MHLCIAGSVRAMPEKEKPPAMPVDIYSVPFGLVYYEEGIRYGGWSLPVSAPSPAHGESATVKMVEASCHLAAITL